MDMTDVPLFSMLKQRMGWLGQRQSVLSQNVANADTPKYTPKDLQAQDFAKALRDNAAPTGMRVSMAVTDPMHIPSANKPMVSKLLKTPDKEADPLGNSVSLEEEMIKVSDTQQQYQAATDLYAKALTMMKTAIGKNG